MTRGLASSLLLSDALPNGTLTAANGKIVEPLEEVRVRVHIVEDVEAVLEGKNHWSSLNEVLAHPMGDWVNIEIQNRGLAISGLLYRDLQDLSSELHPRGQNTVALGELEATTDTTPKYAERQLSEQGNFDMTASTKH